LRLGEGRLGKIGGAGAWRGGDECYDGRAGGEGDPKPVAAMVHFIHPSGESISTITCILGITLLLECIEENTVNQNPAVCALNVTTALQ